MILFAGASGVLGCAGIPYIAQRALEIRGLDSSLPLPIRLLIIAVCAAGATISWIVFDDALSCLTFSFACACISAILACDLRERIIPTGFVALMAALGSAFRISRSGLVDAVSIALPIGVLALCLLVLNYARERNSKPEIIGSGDARMLVPLALFSGWDGLFYGMIAASITVCTLAILQLAIGHASLRSNIALAPGLAAWLFAGTLIPLL